MAAKLEIEMARVPKKPAAKKGPRKAAAKKSVKRGVRNPVATLTKTHAAATKKVATAQKALDRAIASDEALALGEHGNVNGTSNSSFSFTDMRARSSVKLTRASAMLARSCLGSASTAAINGPRYSSISCLRASVPAVSAPAERVRPREGGHGR